MQKKQKELKKSQFRIHRFPEKVMTSYQTFSLQPLLIHVLPNGNKVYALPQDHMPCVVPDMSQFNMPNTPRLNKYFPFDNGKEGGKIPNPAIPLSQLITSR